MTTVTVDNQVKGDVVNVSEPERGSFALSILDDALRWYPLVPGDRRTAELATRRMPVIRRLAPDLSRWGRRRAVIEPGRRYPGLRRQIRRIFRVARRMEQAGSAVPG